MKCEFHIVMTGAQAEERVYAESAENTEDTEKRFGDET